MGERELPQGWVWATLEEVAVQINPGFPSGKHNKKLKGVPHLRPMNISPQGNIDLSEVKYVEASNYDSLIKGDVLFNNTNSPPLVGKTTYINQDTNWAYSNHMTRVRLYPNSLNSAWIAFCLHHLFLAGFFRLHCAHHVNQASINTTFLSQRVKIPLPPLPEQHRIVAEIEKQFTRLDAGVAALKRVWANLRRYRTAVLKAACEGRLVPIEAELARAEGRAYEPAGHLLQRILAERCRKWADDLRAKGKDPKTVKYHEPQAPDTEDLPELPEGWCWASAEQISDFVTKGTTPKANKLFHDGGDIPFIKVYNLTFDGSLDFSVNPTFVSEKTHSGELARSIVVPGDVLMNIVGPPLGKVSVVPTLYPEWNMNQAVARFRPLLDYDNRFLSYCLRSETILNWAVRRAKATAGQFNLTLQICRELPLPVPPLTEQQRIVEEVERRLSVMKELEVTIQSSLKRAERLRQAILKRAFEGRLVPQDLDDEPASALLVRIKKERGKAAEKKNGRQMKLPGV